jgi:DNA (cytosine-5)-methyltransferase 1
MLDFVEVCAGCGGLGSGFIEAGFRPVLMNEIDPVCCETLKRNHPEHAAAVRQCSMRDISLKGMDVDLLMGGVPCQAFSQAGERKGLEDPRGQLLLDFNRLVLECLPRILLVENVRGLATHNKGKTLDSVISLLRNEGNYEIQHRVLNAFDYEVPQKRERMIIVGVRSDVKKRYEFPTPARRKIVLREALKDVPESEGLDYSENKRRVLDMVPEGGCWVDLPEDVKKEYMGNALKSGGGMRGFARRLSMDEPSLTLLTCPSQKQTDRCHPKETRPLTVRDYARIQTFPDRYEFCGTVYQKYRQIGNAVPTRMAWHLANSVKKTLES